MDRETALKQFEELKKYLGEMRLAAESWDEPWKALIAILMSARTRDEVTIVVAERLFKEYPSCKKLANAKPASVAKVIKPVNFYKAKAKNVVGCAKMLVEKYNGNPPHDIDELVELPGVGRKTANVFLAEMDYDAIGVDVHVGYISHYLGWTKHTDPYKVEMDLKQLFPKNKWRHINDTLVRFGKTYISRKKRNVLLDEIKKIS